MISCVNRAHNDSDPKQVQVTLLDDKMYKFGQLFTTFTVTVVNFTTNTYADPRSETATAYIFNDNVVAGIPLFPSLSYDLLYQTLSGAETVTVREDSGDVEVIVARKGGLQGDIRAFWRTEDGSALGGKHYHSASGNITWTEGDTTDKVIAVRLIDDNDFSFTLVEREFEIVLHYVQLEGMGRVVNVTNGPERASTVVTVIEDDGPGVLEVGNSSLSVEENAGNVSVVVRRKGGSAGSVSVTYDLVPNTATTEVSDAGGYGSQKFPPHCGSTEGLHTISNYRGRVVRASCGGGKLALIGREHIANKYETSILTWLRPSVKNNSALWDRKCMVHKGSSGTARHNSFIMWKDLKTYVADTASNTTLGSEKFRIYSDGNTSSSLVDLQDETYDIGSQARPVPFPLQDAVLWIDWQNDRVVIVVGEGVKRFEFAFSQTLDGVLGDSDFMEAFQSPHTMNFYVITDGVRSVHIGCMTKVRQCLLSWLLTAMRPPSAQTGYAR